MRNLLGWFVIVNTILTGPAAAFVFCSNRTVAAGTKYQIPGGYWGYCCNGRLGGGSCVLKLCYEPSEYLNRGWHEASRTLKSSTCYGGIAPR
jgi:hypothetical protein